VAAIPCYNEERYIGSVILKTKKLVDQVLVVDDGSTDRTAEVAEAAGALVVKHNVNQGKGVAINTAFDEARKLGANILVLLDGDGQHEPSEIPRLLQPLLQGKADVVIGSRFLEIKSGIPKYRTIGQRILTLATNLGSGVKLTDSQSGFRAFSPKAIEVLSFREKGLSIESEMQFQIKDKSLQVAEVPITTAYQEKPKRSPIAHGLGVLNSIVTLVTRRLPLLFFSLPGMILLGGGVFTGIKVLEKFSSTSVMPVGTALISVLLCVIGALALFTGIILYAIRPLLK